MAAPEPSWSGRSVRCTTRLTRREVGVRGTRQRGPETGARFCSPRAADCRRIDPIGAGTLSSPAIQAAAAPAPALSSPGLIVPVILSGGSGTRLWPVSRESFPKQYWPLISDQSLLQETASRAVGDGFAPPVLVCNNEHRFLIAEQMRLARIGGARILLEPAGRNSAPAVAAAALLVSESDPDSVLWMLAADHAIRNIEALHGTLARAVTAARAGRFVTFGMKPTAPETGYGYIEVGEELPGLPGVHALTRFIEKPDAASAASLAFSGRHLWNSGMFVFTARTLLAELERFAPDVLSAVREAVARRTQDLDFLRLDPPAFENCRPISLDYAVAEKTRVAAVVPTDLGWSDVGSWGALWEVGDKDGAGNVISGDVITEGASGCYVRSDATLTAVVGLRDAVVVTTKDAVLAMHRDHAQDVKKVVDRLRRAGRPEASAHNRIY
ncbi:MAG: mannose-1-phosphate guanylyltransferase/mannose-6-phosphate isomerase, partial [Acetobacteraceae bacterium]|nr:mannose-1-phosphate guanylyltransferase/mannose-6-phosphate isomerase [Acetobacteraceae bacterium]